MFYSFAKVAKKINHVKSGCQCSTEIDLIFHLFDDGKFKEKKKKEKMSPTPLIQVEHVNNIRIHNQFTCEDTKFSNVTNGKEGI